MTPVRLLVYSDYLCPWCQNGSASALQLEAEYGDALQLEFRSFLLRPHREGDRDLEKFRAYTESWRVPAAEPGAPPFRVWEGDTPPPTHSVPPHLVAKAAAELGPDAFRAIHGRLLAAYFQENRDVSDEATLQELWHEAGLEAAAFGRRDAPEIRERVMGEYAQALECGVSAVPTFMIEAQQVPLAGAQPLAFYRRWLDRYLSGEVG